jgi:polyisoprenoid-binding protein YceI
MAKWTFEPGHTSAEFRARHMMVTWVRGHFKGIHGTLEFDPEHPENSSVVATIDARRLWSGEPARDEHLKSADFLDVENYPAITFRSSRVDVLSEHEGRLHGELTIRGTTRPVTIEVSFLGRWQTPWWEDGVDQGPKTRAGFAGTTRINRKDFGVNWNGLLDRGGIVVSDDVDITIDAEAIRDE